MISSAENLPFISSRFAVVGVGDYSKGSGFYYIYPETFELIDSPIGSIGPIEPSEPLNLSTYSEDKTQTPPSHTLDELHTQIPQNLQKNQNLDFTPSEPIRKALLDQYLQKQNFRVSIGLSTWIPYQTFNPSYNLREILKDEIVIEFDHEDRDLTWRAIDLTAVNLFNAGYSFEIWEHGGKSPHLHIHNLPISNLDDDKRALFKKFFIRRYVPSEYLKFVDLTLTGIHMIAIEWAYHWKGCYDVKKLLSKFNPNDET